MQFFLCITICVPSFCLFVGMNWVVLLLRNDVSQRLKSRVAPTLDFSVSLHQVFHHSGYQIFTASQKWYVTVLLIKVHCDLFIFPFVHVRTSNHFDRYLNVLI